MDWTLQEEVPFVEVGGPGKTIECSPLLVKHPPQTKVQPPHPSIGKGLAGAKATPAVQLSEPEPMTVALEAWPRPATPAGIVPEIIAHHQPTHPVSQQYGALFERMVPEGAAPRVLMLCGLRPHVGATTVLLNLAVTAAQPRRRVAVVDMNWTDPALAARLGHAAMGGLHDVIAGDLAIGQALVATAVPELHLLPGGKGGPLADEAAAWLVAWLRERFDVILIDGPCVEPAAALSGLVAHVDDVYVVLPQDEAEAATRGIAASIARLGGRLRGLIHTAFDREASRAA